MTDAAPFSVNAELATMARELELAPLLPPSGKAVEEWTEEERRVWLDRLRLRPDPPDGVPLSEIIRQVDRELAQRQDAGRPEPER